MVEEDTNDVDVGESLFVLAEINVVEGNIKRGWGSPAIPTLMEADPNSMTIEDVCLDAVWALVTSYFEVVDNDVDKVLRLTLAVLIFLRFSSKQMFCSTCAITNQ